MTRNSLSLCISGIILHMHHTSKSTHRFWERSPNWHFSQQDCNKMMSQYYHLGVQKNYTLQLFYIFLLCLDYAADLIKKLELCLTVASILLKIRFGHAQIRVPKIGIPMSKTACMNLWYDCGFLCNCVKWWYLQERLFFKILREVKQ